MTDVPVKVYSSLSNVDPDTHVLRNGEMPAVVIDVPDGGLAVTFRDSQGNQFGLSFIPAPGSGLQPPQCVDMKVWDTGWTTQNGSYTIDLQRVICFTPGSNVLHSKPEDKVSMITILFPREEAKSRIHVK